MPTEFNQENRFIQIKTQQWQDNMLLKSFGGTDGISRLFSYELNLVTESPITPQDFIGENFTFALPYCNSDSQKFFNGIIATLRSVGDSLEGSESRRSLYEYTATLVPQFWLMTRSSNSRIFQNKSVRDILEQVFNENEFYHFNINLSETHDPREYCVQYRETDFAFLSRLMEEEGIFYYFTHEETRHLMVIADAASEHPDCPDQDRVWLNSPPEDNQNQDIIFSLEKTKTIRSGKYTVKDYNFELPSTDLEREVPTLYVLGPGEREIYDYPGEYKTLSQGNRVANWRMQAEEAKITTLAGNGNCRSFASGHRFRLETERPDINEPDGWVLTQVSHAASQPLNVSGGGIGGEEAYTNTFTCMPYGMPYRHPLSIPKPVIAGVQTAFVVGPSGEEIHTDKHGRVKVQFHWDREGLNDENSSCWIRVAQMWAGAGWGSLFIPRIGQEVVVDFIEGDPDRPIIVGSVYHNNNRPPYPLPDQKTRSTIKSDSSLGGGGSNEIRFEDDAGNEEIYIHAQKDRNDETENDQTLTVRKNRTTTVDQDDELTVSGNRKVDITGNQTLDVTGNQETTVVGSVRIQSSAGTTSIVLDNGVTIQTPGAVEIQGSSLSVSVAGSASVTAGSISLTGTSISLNGSAISLNAPMVTAAGVIQCQSLISSSSVVSPSYTPGAGNIL